MDNKRQLIQRLTSNKRTTDLKI